MFQDQIILHLNILSILRLQYQKQPHSISTSDKLSNTTEDINFLPHAQKAH